ncbi:unnamed protein product [Parnassius mnemosyne]|uniref:THAP-type domain-containing protein n=1 Tax=Parnassius mnemosyne TaxID=213953 RepID=A0AAV1L9B6_9NEOP
MFISCSVLGCKSRTERKICGITFHSFPFNTVTKSKWLEATGRQNWQPTKYSKICSIHFNADAFIFTKKLYY